MLRPTLTLALSVLCQLGAQAATAPRCDVVDQTYDSKDVLCTIPSGPQAINYGFTARFSGGHDDTQALIRPQLNGVAATCDTGSKLNLFGEDGNVSLYCHFAVPAAPASDTQLRVHIHWSHAEYTDDQLSPR